MFGLSIPQLVLLFAVAVAHLVSIAFILLVLFSPVEPTQYPSEATYLTPSAPSSPQPLAHVSSPATVHLSVVVPAYNESLRLGVMLRPAVEYLETRPLDSIKSTFVPSGVDKASYEILIVDDGSTDDTATVALTLARELEQEFGNKRGHVKVCSLVKNRGKGGATRHGVLHASGHRILFVDADGATNFSDLALLEAELDQLERDQRPSPSRPPHGIVVGSRAHLVSTEAVVKRSVLRNLLMRSFHLYLSVLGLRTIRDTQCGFKLHARATCRHVYPSVKSSGWIFDCEVLLVAELCRVPLSEVGVRWHEVEGSKLDVVRDSVRMARDLLVIRGNHWTGRWTSPGTIDVVVAAPRIPPTRRGPRPREDDSEGERSGLPRDDDDVETKQEQ